MTDPLHDLFSALVSDEPPLHITADATAAAGRRLARRTRTLWTATGTAVIVATLAVLPQVWRPAGSGLPAAGHTHGPSATATLEPTPTARPTATPSASPAPSTTAALTLVPQTRQICPHTAPPVRGTDASLLPNFAAAKQAVLAAAPQIAPGFQFTASPAGGVFVGQPKMSGAPFENIIFDVGDAAGYGFLSFQIVVENDASPSVRAARDTNPSACTDVTWYDFPDGSVAVFSAEIPGDVQATPRQVFYYGAGGIQINIGQDSQAYADPASTEPWPPSTLPARGSVPLTMQQVLLLADKVAHAG